MPSISIIDWIYEAEGWFFWPQIVLLLTMLTLVFHCWRTFSERYVIPRSLTRQLAIKPNGLSATQLIELADKFDCDLSDVLRSVILLKSGSSHEYALDLASAMNDVEISMARRLGYLASIANVATLVGLLGTVWGLTGSFFLISQSDIAPRPSELAGGVSQALVTTIFGLITAIPALLVHNHYLGRSQRMLFHIRQISEGCLQQCGVLTGATIPSKVIEGQGVEVAHAVASST
jgi:biopolymer transport protein ExbB